MIHSFIHSFDDYGNILTTAIYARAMQTSFVLFEVIIVKEPMRKQDQPAIKHAYVRSCKNVFFAMSIFDSLFLRN